MIKRRNIYKTNDVLEAGSDNTAAAARQAIMYNGRRQEEQEEEQATITLPMLPPHYLWECLGIPWAVPSHRSAGKTLGSRTSRSRVSQCIYLSPRGPVHWKPLVGAMEQATVGGYSHLACSMACSNFTCLNSLCPLNQPFPSTAASLSFKNYLDTQGHCDKTGFGRFLSTHYSSFMCIRYDTAVALNILETAWFESD